MYLDPRTIQILFMLLESNSPVVVDDMAAQLSISRRTLYRELKNVTPILDSLNLKIETISGKGLMLTGDKTAKNELINKIKNSYVFDPRNRLNRKKLLAALLLKQENANKIFYFSSILQVSESTINNDIDSLISWFEEYNLKIIKRQGLGIYVDGKEDDIRRAFINLAHDMRESDFLTRIKEHKESDVFYLLDEDLFYKLQNILEKQKYTSNISFTEGFAIIFLFYLTIVCQRLICGHKLSSDYDNWRDDDEILYDKSLSFLLESVEHELSISISKCEAYKIQTYLKGAKPRYFNKNIDFLQDDEKMQKLICEMLSCFDPEVKAHLEYDIDFFQALAAHLKPALVRLKHQIGVDNPLLDQIKQSYPDLYQKAIYAANVIKQNFGYDVPENEIGLIAIHFGGAMFRYDTAKHKRKVKIAVICSNGIGISRLLASQIEKAFEGKVKLIIYGDEFKNTNEDGIDFIVSTFAFDTQKKLIRVNPILSDSDIEMLDQYISFYSLEPDCEESEQSNTLLSSIDSIIEISCDIKALLNKFSIERLDKCINFDCLVDYFANKFGETMQSKVQIYKDIQKREKLFTQVVKDYDIVFLHAQTSGTDTPAFAIAYPDGESFTHPYLKKVKTAIGLVTPQNRRAVAGAVSDMLFSRDDFLQVISQRNEKDIYVCLHKMLKKYLRNIANEFI